MGQRTSTLVSPWTAPFLAACAAVGLLAGHNPKLGLGAAIGVAFLGVTFADLSAGVALFGFVIFLAMVPLFGGPLGSFSKLAGLLLALAWLGSGTRTRSTIRRFTGAHVALTVALVGFLTWGAISMVWAADPGTARSELSRYLLNALLFAIVFSAVRERRHVVWVVLGFVVGCAVSAAYGIVQPPSIDAAAGGRAVGTIGDPNELAAVLVVGVALSVGLMASARRAPVLRIIGAGSAALCLLGILLSLSRGGLIALGAAGVMAILLAGRWRITVAVVAFLIATSTIYYFALVASPAARERVTQLGNGTGRTDLWTVAWRMAKANPVQGVGLGNFQNSSIRYLLQPGEIQRADLVIDARKVAHNTYLQAAAETGIPGVLLYLGVVGAALACFWRAAQLFAQQGDEELEILTRALMIGLIGLLVGLVFISEGYMKQLWLLLGMGPAVLAIANARDRSAA